MKIGVFDSGVGGLTVLKEVIKKYPNNKYYYYGDNTNMPYGNKSIEELKLYSTTIIEFLLTKDVDIIIIACGTVSSNLKDYLKNKYSIPIYDIISPTLEYLKQLDKVGVIATERTVKSGVFDNYQVVACPKLVDNIENNKDVNELLKKYLKFTDINYLVLGCTHYPIIESDIKNIFNVTMINMGEILTSQLEVTNEIDGSIWLYFGVVNHKLITNIDKIITKYNLEELCLNYQK